MDGSRPVEVVALEQGHGLNKLSQFVHFRNSFPRCCISRKFPPPPATFYFHCLLQ
jgi:hypothetical protein